VRRLCSCESSTCSHYEALGTTGESLLPFFVQANSGNLQNGAGNDREEVNTRPQSTRDLVMSHREVRSDR